MDPEPILVTLGARWEYIMEGTPIHPRNPVHQRSTEPVTESTFIFGVLMWDQSVFGAMFELP